MKITRQFRTDMNWVHTWAGICLGTLLFVIFWMGTLSVFDKEIDRWMQPETRISPEGRFLDADEILARIEAARPDGDPSELLIYLPRERRPFFEISAGFENADSYGDRLHPVTGGSLGPDLSLGASSFIYPMHTRLLIGGNLGYWIVAFGTIFMMVLLVTGIVIHKKIFIDFFTFRPQKKIGRSSLDLHNVAGVVFWPFHFVICLSGFAIFAGWYASLPFALLKDLSPDNRTVELIYSADDYAYYYRPAAGEQAEMLPLAPLVAQAESIWTVRYGQTAVADRIDVHHYGDRNAFIEVRRQFPSDRAEARRDSVNFDGSTGEVLQDYTASPVRQVRTWLEGFHQAQFDHWTLLWLYFIAGLSGCVVIATGFIYWLSARRRKSVAEQPLHLRLVEAMGVGSTTGIVIATLGYLVVNRILDEQSEVFDLARYRFELMSFFAIWLGTFLHGVARRERAWMDQAAMISVLAPAAVLLNWSTTGDHLVKTAMNGIWPVFGVDLTLLACSIVAGLAAWGLRNYGKTTAQESGFGQRTVSSIEAVGRAE